MRVNEIPSLSCAEYPPLNVHCIEVNIKRGGMWAGGWKERGGGGRGGGGGGGRRGGRGGARLGVPHTLTEVSTDPCSTPSTVLYAFDSLLVLC